MAMVVQHNIAAQLALGELNKNNDKLRKSLEKVASGQKVVGAQDNSSAYSISEKMRIKIRALDQANENVKNGNELLSTAEAGIQQQIELVRTIREKVINASNDTNTEEDRKILEKEIRQFYDQIDQTAYYTDYNTKKVLIGDTYRKTISMWVKAPDVVLDESSIMNIIPDIYDTLDGIEGPFDIFKRFGTVETTIEPLYGDVKTKDFEGGTEGIPSEMTFDFEKSYSEAIIPDDLNGKGFSVTGVSAGGGRSTLKYVLTTNPSTLYNGNYIKIDISSCGTLDDIAAAVANTVSSYQGNYFSSVTASGASVNFVSANDYTAENKNMSIAPSSISATSVTPAGRQGATKTGLTPVPQYLSGGTDDVYKQRMITEPRYIYDPNTDRKEYVPGSYESFLTKPGSKATLTVDVSSFADGSGVVVSGNTTSYIKFVDGDTITQDSDGVWLVGKSAEGSASSSISGMILTMSGGKMTLTALSNGTYANRYSISADGFEEIQAGKTINYSAVSALSAQKDTGSGGDWTFTDGTDGEYAHCDTLDLTPYDTNDLTTLNEFINAIKGKSISTDDKDVFITFIDTTVPYSREAMMRSGYNIDLKELRQRVRNGKNISDAFIDMLTDKLSPRGSLNTDKGKKVLRIRASKPGLQGNNEHLNFTESNLAYYDVDFKSWFGKNSNKLVPSVAEYLDGKAIRVYCATCYEQWYNIEFYTPAGLEGKPESTSKADYTPIPIDVSNVTDYKSLVQAIYDQGAPQFQRINHFTYLAANPDEGILTVYDNRAFDPLSEPEIWSYPNAQEKGAKIADGRVSDVIRIQKDLLEKRFIIHDTDKASMNIRIRIPDMRVDSIFGLMPQYGKSSIRDYSLNSKEDRKALLGNPPVKGIIDNGLEYLLDATVLVGAQNARLEHTKNNLTTMVENVQASESVIRDADMAKEMTEYTKNNVLSQAAQAILAQANQNSSSVLSLLQ